MRFWLPWWLFPVYLVVGIVLLPIRLVWVMIFGQRRQRREPAPRVRIIIRERETPPPRS